MSDERYPSYDEEIEVVYECGGEDENNWEKVRITLPNGKELIAWRNDAIRLNVGSADYGVNTEWNTGVEQ